MSTKKLIITILTVFSISAVFLLVITIIQNYNPSNIKDATSDNNASLYLSLVYSTTNSSVSAISFNPATDNIVLGISTGQIKTLDFTKSVENIITPIENTPVTALAFTNNGKILAIAYKDGSNISFWSMENKKLISKINLPIKSITDLQYNNDDKMLAIKGQDIKCISCRPGVFVISTNENKILFEQSGASDFHINTFDFNPKIDLLAYGVLSTSPDESPLYLWSGSKIRSPKLGNNLIGETDAISALAFSPDGKFLAFGHKNLKTTGVTLDEWSLEKEQNTNQITNQVLNNLTWLKWITYTSKNKKVLLVGSDDLIRGWDTETYQQLFVTKSHPSKLSTITISHDKKFLSVLYADGSLQVWKISL